MNLLDHYHPHWSKALKMLQDLVKDGDLAQCVLKLPATFVRPEGEVTVSQAFRPGTELSVVMVALDGQSKAPYAVLNIGGTTWTSLEWRELGEQIHIPKFDMSLGALLMGELQARHKELNTPKAASKLARPPTQPVPAPTYKEEALEPDESVLAWLEQHEEGSF